MHKSYQGNSFAFDACPQCQAAIHEHDRFCRHCGIEFGELTELLAIADLLNRPAAEDSGNALPPYATVPFVQLDARHPVSGPLIKLVTRELTILNGNPFARRATLILITFPIWLMMILLSPLDAYAAMKLIARQI